MREIGATGDLFAGAKADLRKIDEALKAGLGDLPGVSWTVEATVRMMSRDEDAKGLVRVTLWFGRQLSRAVPWGGDDVDGLVACCRETAVRGADQVEKAVQFMRAKREGER